MSPELHSGAGRAVRFPRVSGDEPAQGVGGKLGKVFSPRERG